MSANLYLGVDLGGTSIKLGICDEQGALLHRHEGPTHSEQGVDAVMARIAEYGKQLVESSGNSWEHIRGVGIGIPGFMNMEDGIVRLAPNLRWRNVPVRPKLEQLLDKPIRINNDANCAALAESWVGAGSGADNMVLYTLGTGVGGAIIIDGKIYAGYNGSAGELGHMKIVPDLEAVQCGCGQTGCLETVSSATGIIRMAQDAVERGDVTTLSAGGDITAKAVFDAAAAGDEVAIRIVQRAAHYLGKSMAMIALVINPQLFVIGGGVAQAGDILFEPIRQSFEDCATDSVREGVRILPATLGNDAGMIGAAGLHIVL